jgi:hypothetical protein
LLADRAAIRANNGMAPVTTSNAPKTMIALTRSVSKADDQISAKKLVVLSGA